MIMSFNIVVRNNCRNSRDTMLFTLLVHLLAVTGCLGVPLPWLENGGQSSPTDQLSQTAAQNVGNILSKQAFLTQSTQSAEQGNVSSTMKNGLSLSLDILKHMNGLELLNLLGVNIKKYEQTTDASNRPQTIHSLSGRQHLQNGNNELKQNSIIMNRPLQGDGAQGNVIKQPGLPSNGGLLGSIGVQNGHIQNVAVTSNEHLQNVATLGSGLTQNTAAQGSGQVQNMGAVGSENVGIKNTGYQGNIATLSTGQNSGGILGNIQIQNGQVLPGELQSNEISGHTQNGLIQNTVSLVNGGYSNGQAQNTVNSGQGQLQSVNPHIGQQQYTTSSHNDAHKQYQNGMNFPQNYGSASQTNNQYGNVYSNVLNAAVGSRPNIPNAQNTLMYNTQAQGLGQSQNEIGQNIPLNQSINNGVYNDKHGTNMESAQNSYNPSYLNQAQMYTNPVLMLSAGMGSTDSNGAMQNMQSFFSGSKISGDGGQYGIYGQNTGVAFDPNALMTNMISSASKYYNPDAYNAQQSYISTNSWGMTNSDSNGAKYHVVSSGLQTQGQSSNGASQNKSPQQRPVSVGIKGQTNTLSKQQSTQFQNNNVHQEKTISLLNNVMRPSDNQQKSNVMFSFDPDKINFSPGGLNLGLMSPMPSSTGTSGNTVSQIPYNADSINKHLMSLTSVQSNQQQQHARDQSKKIATLKHSAIPKYDPDTFNSARIEFRPAKFLGLYTSGTISDMMTTDIEKDLKSDTYVPTFQAGELYPKYRPSQLPLQGSEQAKATNDQERSNLEILKARPFSDANFEPYHPTRLAFLKKHRSQNIHVSTEKGTRAQNMSTSEESNLSRVGNVTGTPIISLGALDPQQNTTKINASSNGQSNSYNTVNKTNPYMVSNNGGQIHTPYEVNMQTTLNSNFFTGMIGEQTSNTQFGPTSEGNNPFAFHTAGTFNPSEVNTAHMSFNLQEQMGISGNSQKFNQNMQNFNGVYDPNKTNLMAIQNPFSSSNNTEMGSNSGFGGSMNNFGFISKFDPNSVNHISSMLTHSNSSIDSMYNGGSDYMKMFFGAGMSGLTDSSAFVGSFNPSDVNKAVFNPNEVNNIHMNFDPSEMLEKNPGYNKNNVDSHSFNPNKFNSVKGHSILNIFNNKSENKSSYSTTDVGNNGIEFVPGLLTGGGGSQSAVFNPNSVNNAHMNFSPMNVMKGISSLLKNDSLTMLGNGTHSDVFHPLSMNQNSGNIGSASKIEQIQTGNSVDVNFVPGLLTGSSTSQSAIFNPSSVNNAHMNFSPAGFINEITRLSKNGTQNNRTLSLPFDPTTINNVQMHFDPSSYQTNASEDKDNNRDNAEFLPGSFPSGAVNFSPVFTKTGNLNEMVGQLYGGRKQKEATANKDN